MLSDISLGITVVFVIELIVFTWAFGPMYYLGSVLHFCDAAIIIATFVLEVVFKGRDRDLAAVLILFRLVRFAGGGMQTLLGVSENIYLKCRTAAVGVGELDEETKKELEKTRQELDEKTQALEEKQEEVEALKLKLSEMGGAST